MPAFLSSASPFGLLNDLFSPHFAAMPLDWLAVATSSALVFWGLFFGLWLGSRLARRNRTDAGQASKAAVGGAAEADSPEARAASETARPGNSEAVALAGELAESREICERQAEEITLLGERFALLRHQMDEGALRLGELSKAMEETSSYGPVSRRALTQARLSVLHLGETMRSECEHRGAHLAHLERLESRLREESETLAEGSKFIAGVRADLGKSAEAGDLRERFARVDDQLRVLHQNVAGCVAKAERAREHLQEECRQLREAMAPLDEAEQSLKSDESEDAESIRAILERVRENLSGVRAAVEETRGDLEQEIGELIGRIDWAVRESPAGFLKAVDALQEGNADDEPGLASLTSEVWRRLGEMRGSLAGMGLVLESGAVSVPAGRGKRRLGEAVASAISALEIACRFSERVENGHEGEENLPASGDSTAERTASSPAGPGLADELQALRFSNAARDGEIAKLTRRLRDREAEIDTLRREMEEGRQSRSVAPATPAAGAINPVAARLAPVPVKRPQGENGSSGPASSRQFIRRLLGIGGAGRRGMAGAASSAGVSENAVAVPAASLAEARAALTDLRRRPVIEAMPGGVGGGNGTEAKISGEDGETASADTEFDQLREALAERGARISALEAEVAALKHAALKAEAEPVPEREEITESADLELPFIIGTEAAGVSPGAVEAGNEPCVIGAGNSVPVTEEEVVIFRGRDPRLWNSRSETENLDASEDEELAGFSRPLDQVPDEIGFVRLRRLDTGESVVATISRDALVSGGSAKARRGWSGRGEQYFGACHLGLFDESLPREVETKFGAGGWGFGHRESIGSGQAFAWAGRAIEDPGDGIEISVGPLPPGTKIEPFATAESDDRTEPVPEPVAQTGPRLPMPITAATVAAAIAETATPAASETEEEAGAREAEVSPSAGVDLDALARQADNRTSGLVLFRANDPGIWGANVFAGANRRARPLDRLPEGIAYLRLRRMDTGQGVVISVTNAGLTDDADGRPRGFNGTNERFYGAYHLGIFDESLPQDVETRFTYGGWGFGHSVLGPEQQACGWEGKVIDPDTVFEIAVFRRMPVLGDHDRMIDR